MIEYTKFKITKFEAARRQLDCAIELWFLDKDPISVHTLAAAAHQIIHDIYQKTGGIGIAGYGLIYDSIIIKDEYRKEYVEFVRDHANFLKHADRDPESELEFNSAGSFIFMFYSVLALDLFRLVPNQIESMFINYVILAEPNWMSKDYRKKLLDVVASDLLDKLAHTTKREFYDACVAQGLLRPR